MNIIIPLGGTGQRFLETGFNLPKPLIQLLFKPIIFWLLDSLKPQVDDNIIIICNKGLRQYRFLEQVKKSYNNITVQYLDNDTRGAAETVLCGLSNVNLEHPTILLDGDTFYNVDILDLYRKSTNKNIVFSFKQKDSRPIYSYVKVVNGIVRQIAEKNPISKLANTGAYAFNSGSELKQYCEQAVKKFDKSKQKELYTSSIIADMIEDEHVFNCVELSTDDFEVVGTPLQYKLFHNKHKSDKKYFSKYRICFDFDNTLITYPTVPGDYTTVEPIADNIKYAQHLHDLGCTIIIYTARRMKTHNGNVGKIIQDVGKTTLDTIEKYNIPCDELYFGKPFAHAYIDDLAYNAHTDYPFQLGLTDHCVQARDFNNVNVKTLEVFKKTSSNKNKIEAEILWYKNIPVHLKTHTPELISSDIDQATYMLEQIPGINFSELLVSRSLSDTLFNKLLQILHEFHVNTPGENIKLDVYSNYAAKVTQRYNSYNYTKYNKSKQMFDNIIKKLKEYEFNDMAIVGCIHGDPVFSNVMVDNFSQIKFIDPRGLSGDNQFTVYGDVMYDYAKVLQSLKGYDEIMLTGENRINTTAHINTLKEHVARLYGKEYIAHIETIADSLLFSLIPLHDNQNCIKYYSLINENILHI